MLKANILQIFSSFSMLKAKIFLIENSLSMSLFPKGGRDPLIVVVCHFFSCHYLARREGVKWKLHDVILLTFFMKVASKCKREHKAT